MFYLTVNNTEVQILNTDLLDFKYIYYFKKASFNAPFILFKPYTETDVGKFTKLYDITYTYGYAYY